MAGWIALEGEALDDYLSARMAPLEARETEHGVEVFMPHTFSGGPGSDKRCWHCGLLPLDYDRIEVACKAVECRHCGREVVRVDEDKWVDLEAEGDDEIWRETCADNHEDRIAAHEPKEN